MDNMRCRVWQDQEPDIDEVLSRQGLGRIHEFGFEYPYLEYDQGAKWSSTSRRRLAVSCQHQSYSDVREY